MIDAKPYIPAEGTYIKDKSNWVYSFTLGPIPIPQHNGPVDNTIIVPFNTIIQGQSNISRIIIDEIWGMFENQLLSAPLINPYAAIAYIKYPNGLSQLLQGNITGISMVVPEWIQYIAPLIGPSPLIIAFLLAFSTPITCRWQNILSKPLIIDPNGSEGFILGIPPGASFPSNLFWLLKGHMEK